METYAVPVTFSIEARSAEHAAEIAEIYLDEAAHTVYEAQHIVGVDIEREHVVQYVPETVWEQ
jgi:hypothetical protein